MSFNDAVRDVKPLLGARAVLESLAAKAVSDRRSRDPCSSWPLFFYEVASFNLEAVPGKPLGCCSRDMLDVELNMKLR